MSSPLISHNPRHTPTRLACVSTPRDPSLLHSSPLAVSTCDAHCLCADRFHTGLCITADGPAPPSIKRRHQLFKAAGPQALCPVSLWNELATDNDCEDSEVVKRLKVPDEE